jgi:hypothetical protein
LIERSGVILEYLEDLRRKYRSNTFPQKLDKILDQRFITFSTEFIVLKIDIIEPGRLERLLSDRLQQKKVVNSPGIQNINTEVQVTAFKEIALLRGGMFRLGRKTIDDLGQPGKIFRIIGDSFEPPVALECVAEIVAEPQNTLIAMRGLGIFLIAHVQIGVIGDRVPESAEILVVTQDRYSQKVLSIADFKHGVVLSQITL